MKFKVRQEDNISVAEELHNKTGFENDVFPRNHIFWIARDEQDSPVAFCSISLVDKDTIFLSRAGVIKKYRGKKLHKRMIRARENYARRNGYKWIITYTLQDNVNSFVHLIKNNYQIYEPSWDWAGKDCIYFRKRLTSK